MFLCNKCNYLYNITKVVKTKQVGGKISEALTNIFNKFRNNIKFVEKDLHHLHSEDILNDDNFESMNKKDQRKLVSNIKAIDKNFFNKEVSEEGDRVNSNIAYFICKFCKNYEPIKPGTLIYSKNYNDVTVTETTDYTYDVYDFTLPRTKNYICKNTKCETHNDDSLKEAILTKNSIEQIVYICTSCSTNWTNTI